MNWIDMTDRDKLFNYAKEFAPRSFRILNQCDNADSYYFDCADADNNNIFDVAIMKYDVDSFIGFKKCLVDMWDKKGFKDVNMLATIVSATALKNMPVKTEDDPSRDEPAKKETYETVSAGDSPTDFVYEF